MEMGTIRTKVSRSHSEIRAFLSLTFSSPNPTYDIIEGFKDICYKILPMLKFVQYFAYSLFYA